MTARWRGGYRLPLGRAVIDDPIDEDKLGVGPTAQSQRTVTAEVLMDARNFVVVRVDARDVLAARTIRLTSKRRRRMTVSQDYLA